MRFYKSQDVINTFNDLNESGSPYLLFRNLDSELPEKLLIGKDIDLLVHYEDEEKIKNTLEKKSFKKIDHPHSNDTFLYGVKPFTKLESKQTGIQIDLNFEIAVQSFENRQWIPLDVEIQNSAWDNKQFLKLENGISYWTLGFDDEFITLVSRSIFDKRQFHLNYQNRINELYPLINMKNVEIKLEKVFFNYTSMLLLQIQSKEFDNIIKNYFQFTDY